MPSDTIAYDRENLTVEAKSSERKNYAYLANNSLSEQSLRKIYVSKVGSENEAKLVRFVNKVDLLLADDDVSGSTESLMFEALASLGLDVVLKYLIGLKIAVLLPTLQAGAANRWGDVDLEENVILLRRLNAMIEVVISRCATIH